MQHFATLAALLPLVAAHGFVQDPPAREPGTAYKAACGEQPFNQQSSDINGNVQGIMQVVGTDFDAEACNLWLCKGFLLDDNKDNVQSFSLGETIPFTVTIAAPHTGYANVSVVKTSTNSIIGEPLIEFSNYASNAGVAANNSAFSVTLPDDLGSDCTTAGDCVLQWFWDAPDIDQTYESCVDFTVGGSSSGGSESAVSSAVASTAAASSAAASTVVAVSSKAASSEAASSVVTTALAAVTQTGAVTTAEAPAATTSAAATDDEECPADDDDEYDDGEDDSADDDECPADDEADDGEDDSADDEECPADDEYDDDEDTDASITQAAVSVTQAASVTAAAQVSSSAAAQSGSSGSGNGSGNYSAVTSYVTVSGKPQTKHHTKYVTVTAAAPACTN